jgi:hypothetical protein
LVDRRRIRLSYWMSRGEDLTSSGRRFRLQGNSRQPGRLGKNKRLSDAWLRVTVHVVTKTNLSGLRS